MLRLEQCDTLWLLEKVTSTAVSPADVVLERVLTDDSPAAEILFETASGVAP